MSQINTFSIAEVVRERMTLCVEIRVTGQRMFKLRLMLAKPLLRLAARVIGCGIEVKTAE